MPASIDSNSSSKNPKIASLGSLITLSHIDFTLPLTRENLFFHYIPLMGRLNYEVLPFAIIRNTIIERFFGSIDSAGVNLHVLMAILGFSLHSFKTSKRFSKLSPSYRGIFSVYQGTSIVLGSVLFLGILNRCSTNNWIFRTCLAVLSNFGTSGITYSLVSM